MGRDLPMRAARIDLCRDHLLSANMTSLVKAIQERLAKIAAEYVSPGDGEYAAEDTAKVAAEIASAIRAADLSDLERRSDRQAIADLIFDIIKHGDEAHQGWLRFKSIRVAEAILAMPFSSDLEPKVIGGREYELETQVAALTARLEDKEAEIQDASSLAFNLLLDRTEDDAKSDLCEQIDLLGKRYAAECARLRLPPEMTLSDHPGCVFCMEAGTPVRLGEVCPKCGDRLPTKREHELRAEYEALRRDAEQKPVAWFKHGPYKHGEHPKCVLEDPHDDVCYSALIYKSYAAKDSNE